MTAAMSGDRSSLYRVRDALDSAGCHPREHGDHLDARCPSHEDREPSLSVDWRSRVDGGLVVMKCHTGCPIESITGALALRMSDLYDGPGAGYRAGDRPAPITRPAKPERTYAGWPGFYGPLVAEYAYSDAEGRLVALIGRFGTKSGGKTFRVRRPHPDQPGRWLLSRPKSMPLYRLPDVLAAIEAGRTVYVVEGEKDADTLAELGHAATTSPFGAKNAAGWGRGEWAEALAGADVIVWADRDAPGYAYAATVAAGLTGVAKSVLIVRTTLDQDKADASDHLAAGLALDAVEPVPVAEFPAETGDGDRAPVSGGNSESTPDNVVNMPGVPLVGPQPDYPVNVTASNPYRYSAGGRFGHAMYEFRRSEWVRRADLPQVLARIVRRDGSGRRVGTSYLVALAAEGSSAVIVTDAELADGSWAVKIGANLSSDRTIITAAGTAIRDLAHREAPEREAVARADVHTATGHLDMPVRECLPTGYLNVPPMADEMAIRARLAEVFAVVARHPKLALTAGASAGAPYVGPLRRQSHWWDLSGEQRKGKSTAQAVAAALWGDPRIGTGIVLPWNASSIGSGRHLGQLGILPPFFDERGVSRLTRPEWGELVYSTTQGGTRLTAEMKGDGVRRSAPWFGVLFSTGNARLTDGIEAGRFAGVPARVVELAAPFTDSAAESDLLVKSLLPQCYGWLGARIIERFPVPVVADLIRRAAELVGYPEGGEPRTISEHLHTAVAGAMMIDAVIGTGGTVERAAVEAAREYLTERDHAPMHDADRMLSAIGEVMSARRGSWPTDAEYVELGRPRPEHFGDARTSGRAELAQHGYAAELSGVRTADRVYVFSATWRALIEESGADSSVALAELHARGLLHVAPTKRAEGKWTDRQRIGGKLSPHLYNLAASVFLHDEADETSEPEPGPVPPVSGGNSAERPRDPSAGLDLHAIDFGQLCALVDAMDAAGVRDDAAYQRVADAITDRTPQEAPEPDPAPVVDPAPNGPQRPAQRPERGTADAPEVVDRETQLRDITRALIREHTTAAGEVTREITPELASATLDAWHRVTRGLEWRDWAGATGIAAYYATRAHLGQDARGIAGVERLDEAIPQEWRDAVRLHPDYVDLSVVPQLGQHVTELDINAQFLASSDIPLGNGMPLLIERPGALSPLLKVPGYVRLATAAETDIAAWAGRLEAGAVLPMPSVQYLTKRGVRLNAEAAYVWAQGNHRAHLRVWKDRFRDAWQQLQTCTDDGSMLALKLIKSVVTVTLGGMLRSADNPTDLMRRDWSDHIIAEAWTRALVKVDKAAELGNPTMGMRRDSAWFLSDSAPFIPEGIEVKRQLGKWKVSRHAPVNEDMIAAHAGGSPDLLNRAIKAANEARKAAEQ